jgi:hypothetical protein
MRGELAGTGKEVVASSNTLDQLVNAPGEIDNLALSLQFELDRIISRSCMI